MGGEDSGSGPREKRQCQNNETVGKTKCSFTPRSESGSQEGTHNMLSHKDSVACWPFWILCYNFGRASDVVEPKWTPINACGGARASAVNGEAKSQDVTCGLVRGLRCLMPCQVKPYGSI